MRLVIEREGGFTIVEDADAITENDVRNDAGMLTSEVGGDKWVTTLPVKDHAAACRLSAAIAVRCGELVEPLAGAPGNGLEDAEDDDAMGAVMAGRIRKPASEWVDGEPPRDERWYVVGRLGEPTCVMWDGRRYRDWCTQTIVRPESLAHLPSPVPDVPE